MLVLLVFTLALLGAVLLSSRASRTALSTALVMLVVGYLVGPGGLGLVALDPRLPIVAQVAELALFSTLLSEGLGVDIKELRSDWHPAGRALFVGLPLTMLFAALIAHGLLGISWRTAWLLGAVLAPTDPVFAAGLVRRKGVSPALRRLLNVESGFNDGLALPVVLALLPHPGEGPDAAGLLLPLGGGIALGVVLPWVMHRVEQFKLFGIEPEYRATAGFGFGLLVYVVARLTRANSFLAAFSAGITARTVRPELSDAFRGYIEGTADLLKFAGIFVFGALLSPSWLFGVSVWAYVFAVLMLVAVRPVAIAIALIGSELDARERAVAAWFGPKGFSSVLYATLVVAAAPAGGLRFFELAALVVTLSIVAHSSTDVLAARWLGRAESAGDAAHRMPAAAGRS
ncbi:MAG TPA: cation:proton antiporter [Gemmatimonadales bacterium]|nr:cation:proton antiporter [Gemmatimonadales bacterium]